MAADASTKEATVAAMALEEGTAGDGGESIEGRPDAKAAAPADADDDEGTADWNSLYCIYLAVVADAIAGAIIVPYSAVWTKEIFHMDNVGLYAGLLVGISSFAAALSSPVLGWLSDVIGRRGLILVGLSSVAVFNLIGAFVMDYSVALAMHGIAGLLDSTQSVAYAAVGDLTTGAQRQAAFGYSSAAFAAARILSSVVGGYTYGIEPDTMRVIFKNMPGHGAPLLSHFIASGLCIAAIIAFLLLYVDTSPAALKRQARRDAAAAAAAAATVHGDGDPGEEGQGQGQEAAPAQDMASASTAAATTAADGDDDDKAPSFVEGLRYVAGNRMLVIFIGCYAFTNLLSGMTLMAIPLLSSDQTRGLHMSTYETGMVLLLFMSFYFLYNQLLFRRVLRRLGQKRANSLGIVLIAVGVMGFPFVEAVVPCHTPLMWAVLTIVCAIAGSGYMMVNTIFAAVISSHADPGMQGVAQGVSKMLAALTRGVGPMLLGPLFEWAANDLGYPFVAFMMISIGYVSVLFVVGPIPRPIFEKKPTNKK